MTKFSLQGFPGETNSASVITVPLGLISLLKRSFGQLLARFNWLETKMVWKDVPELTNCNDHWSFHHFTEQCVKETGLPFENIGPYLSKICTGCPKKRHFQNAVGAPVHWRMILNGNIFQTAPSSEFRTGSSLENMSYVNLPIPN